MGPTCEVSLPSEVTAETLRLVDAYLHRTAEIVQDTRKGRSWDIWVGGRPVSISAEANAIGLSAGSNSSLDYSLLKQIGEGLAAELGGTASTPVK